MKKALPVLLLAALCFSCEKEDVKAGENVEIYLLKSYQTVASKCQIEASSASLKDTALVENQDIVEYSQSDYQFKLKDSAIQKIKSLRDKTPFAVTVDKKIIYYGFFKPGFSSSSCDNSITMDINWLSKDKIILKLGYPSPIQGGAIDDQRNNSRILGSLKKQGKLK